MIKIENVTTCGWESAFRGMRAPLQSWDKSDSLFYPDGTFSLGEADLNLAKRLIKAGTEHRKFLRFIHVQMDIIAPSYLWAEIDTYKVATNRNSCSFMHKGTAEEFYLLDFSYEEMTYQDPEHRKWWEDTLDELNRLRAIYLDTKDPIIFQEIRNMLPSGYMIRATYDCSLETLLNICHQRVNHRLPEWRVFVSTMLEKVPYLKDFYRN